MADEHYELNEPNPGNTPGDTPGDTPENASSPTPGNTGGQAGQEGASATPPPADETAAASKDERMWAMFAHLAGLSGYSILPGVGLVVGPLIVWLIKREEMPLVDDQGKEALNFKLTIMIAEAALLVLSLIPVVGCITGPAFLAVVVIDVVFTVLATIEANNGKRYRYPFSLKLIQ